MNLVTKQHDDITLTYYTAPVVTMISVPDFIHPRHLPVEFEGEASPAAQLAEYAGRICYMSQSNPAHRTTQSYLSNIFAQGHGSVLEHANVSMLLEGVSRSLTHELVRHRAGWAYSQLSQRYVNLSDTAFVIPPAFIGRDTATQLWEAAMIGSLRHYNNLSQEMLASLEHVEDKVLRRKMARESARSVLPNATETKIVATANIRAWRHFLALRGSVHADQEIRRLAFHCYARLASRMPEFFSDVQVDYTTEIPSLNLEHPKV